MMRVIKRLTNVMVQFDFILVPKLKGITHSEHFVQCNLRCKEKFPATENRHTCCSYNLRSENTTSLLIPAHILEDVYADRSWHLYHFAPKQLSFTQPTDTSHYIIQQTNFLYIHPPIYVLKFAKIIKLIVGCN